MDVVEFLDILGIFSCFDNLWRWKFNIFACWVKFFIGLRYLLSLSFYVFSGNSSDFHLYFIKLLIYIIILITLEWLIWGIVIIYCPDWDLLRNQFFFLLLLLLLFLIFTVLYWFYWLVTTTIVVVVVNRLNRFKMKSLYIPFEFINLPIDIEVLQIEFHWFLLCWFPGISGFSPVFWSLNII